MQDIVPKKSIREITKPHMPGSVAPRPAYQKAPDVVKVAQESTAQFDEYPHTKAEFYPKEKKRGWILALFVVTVLVAVGGFLHFQKSATVYVTSKEEILTFKDADILIPLSDLNIVSVATSTNIEIKTSTGTPALMKARGTVTIYNANSTEQLLVAGTRLQTPNGKIYRLDGRITVPKMINSSTPGSIQALVTADKSGESYNVSQADFTLPGLVGSARYKIVYARTKGPIAGGSETAVRLVDEKDKAEKIAMFLTENKVSLEAKLRIQKPASTTIIQEPVTTSGFEKVSDTQGVVTITSSMRVLDTKEFATLLTKSQKQNTVTKMEFAQSPASLVVAYVAEEKDGVRIKVSGSASVRPYVDIEKIKNVLAGTSMKQFRESIQGVQGVQEIRFTSKPFWVTTFPSTSRIFVEQK
jgi:hypothetical protein